MCSITNQIKHKCYVCRQDIEGKKEELRQMVGYVNKSNQWWHFCSPQFICRGMFIIVLFVALCRERYRDLIEAADTISEMKRSTDSVCRRSGRYF